MEFSHYFRGLVHRRSTLALQSRILETYGASPKQEEDDI